MGSVRKSQSRSRSTEVAASAGAQKTRERTAPRKNLFMKPLEPQMILENANGSGPRTQRISKKSYSFRRGYQSDQSRIRGTGIGLHPVPSKTKIATTLHNMDRVLRPIEFLAVDFCIARDPDIVIHGELLVNAFSPKQESKRFLSVPSFSGALHQETVNVRLCDWLWRGTRFFLARRDRNHTFGALSCEAEGMRSLRCAHPTADTAVVYPVLQSQPQGGATAGRWRRCED